MVVLQVANTLVAREFNEKKSKMTDDKDKQQLLVAQELKIARALAGNDKVIRGRALKSLKKWFRHRSQNLPFTEEDFLRLWKGLFYSMWMSDKPLIQEECAENISNLLHELPLEHALVFFKCGFQTLVNEWFGIDQLRLDKFMMFTRRFLRHGLMILKKDEFKINTVDVFGDILSSTVLRTDNKNCIGLFMHVTEIFLEELAKVTEGNLDPDLVTVFITPFIKCMVVSEEARISHIRKFIFIYLIKQSDLALEYDEKYKAWKMAGFPGTIHSMQKVDTEVDEIESDGSEKDDENNEEDSGEKPLDPRAGRVDVVLPQIKFNPKSISDELLRYKFLKTTTVAARKVISILIRQFNIMARNVYPLGVTSLKLPKSEVKDMKLKSAVNRLVKFEKKLMGQDTRTLKRKMKQGKLDKKSKKAKLEHETSEDELENVFEVEDTKIKKKPQVKKKEVSSNDWNIFNVDTPLKKKAKTPDSLQGEPEGAFERNSGVWFVFQQDESMLLDSSCEDLGFFLENELENISRGSDEATGNENKNSTGEIFPENPWDQSVKEGEYEIVIPAKSYVDKLKKISKKSSQNVQELIHKRLGKTRHSLDFHAGMTGSSTPQGEKRVKINTKLNKSQEFHEYHWQVLSSPVIKFDGSKKPGKPALKTPTLASPVNPFYRKL